MPARGGRKIMLHSVEIITELKKSNIFSCTLVVLQKATHVLF